jgi:membrane-bound serine protease (ClpP class)
MPGLGYRLRHVRSRETVAMIYALRFAGRAAAALTLLLGLGAAGPAPPPDSRPDSLDLVPQPGTAVELDIDGAIGPAVSDYVVRGIRKAHDMGAALIVLRMNTPGGLDTSMREIIQAILASPVPVASFVPSGGRAASAGTYIMYASHIAAMAPGANLGAATPVQLGGGSSSPLPGLGGGDDGDKGSKDDKSKKSGKGAAPPPARHPTMEDKALNDAIAYIRSLAQMRGRNVAWAEQAVRQAASLPAEDALRMHVIDLMASDVRDLVSKLDGRSVTTGGRKRDLVTRDMKIVRLAPDWRSEILSVITNPNVAYMLMVIGMYGLIFEFLSPGMVAPGIFGGISLLLGLYALQLLPVNYAGLALTLLGIALMVAEFFLPTFGVVGIGGVVSFVIGSVLLIDTDVPGFGLSLVTVAAIAAVSAGFFLLVVTFVLRARKRAVVSGPEQMVGATGRVVDWNGTEGRVRVQGEIWSARAHAALQPGASVRVHRLDGLTIEVEPAATPAGATSEGG